MKEFESHFFQCWCLPIWHNTRVVLSAFNKDTDNMEYICFHHKFQYETEYDGSMELLHTSQSQMWIHILITYQNQLGNLTTNIAQILDKVIVAEVKMWLN